MERRAPTPELAIIPPMPIFPQCSYSSPKTSSNCERSASSVTPSFARVSNPKKTTEAINPRQSRAVSKGFKKQCAFNPNDVPYPVGYDPKVVALDVLDHIFVQQARKHNVTWVDFKNGTPKRSLDLGCGNSSILDWVIAAAKKWKDCHLIGFDVMSVQPGPALLDKMGVAGRVQWVIGNFLTQKLPFENNYFDHVHVYRIGWGVAEDKWDGLFEEIARVLRPGGAIEIGEEDILFPVLPKSYTLKTKSDHSNTSRPSLTLSPPRSPSDETTNLHAHSLLESLYYGVFASRKINCRPTCILPHYLNIHFRHVISTPNVELPMPPPPVSRQLLRRMSSGCTARIDASSRPTELEPISDLSLSPSSSTSSLQDQPQQQRTPPTTDTSSLGGGFYSELSFDVAAPRSYKIPQAYTGSFESSCTLSNVSLLPPVPLELNNRNLAVHLNSTFRRIIACKEAMWDELRRRIHLRNAGGPDLLSRLGWDDVVDGSGSAGLGQGGADWSITRELEKARARFEDIILRFERDMLHRTALADAIESNLGWKKPPAEPMNKHERARQKELERAIAAALLKEPEEQEQLQISRSFKGFIGFKEGRRW